MLILELIAIAILHFGASGFVVCIILAFILTAVIGASGTPATNEDDDEW